jgi:hypothetical protein
VKIFLPKAQRFDASNIGAWGCHNPFAGGVVVIFSA